MGCSFPISYTLPEPQNNFTAYAREVNLISFFHRQPGCVLHAVIAMLGMGWAFQCCGAPPLPRGAGGAAAGGKVDDQILKVINEEARLNFLAGRTIDLNVAVPFEKMATFHNSNQLFLSSGQVAGGILKRETYLANAPAALKARRDEVAKVFGARLAEGQQLVLKPSNHAELFLLILTNALVQMGSSTGDARAQLADRLQLLFNDDMQRRNAKWAKQPAPPDRDQAWLDHLVEQTEAALFTQLKPTEQGELIRVWPICFPKGEFPLPDRAKLAKVVVEPVKPAVGPPTNPGAGLPAAALPGPVGAPPPAVDPAHAGRPQPAAGKVDDEILKIVNEETRINFLGKRASELDIQPPADKGPALLNSSELLIAANRVSQGFEARDVFLARAPTLLKARREEVEKLFGAKLAQAQVILKQPENQAALFVELLTNSVGLMNLPMDDLRGRAVLGSSAGKLAMEDIQRRNAKTMHRPPPPMHDRAWLDKFTTDVEAKLLKELKPNYQAELIRIWPIVFPDGPFQVPDAKKMGAVPTR